MRDAEVALLAHLLTTFDMLEPRRPEGPLTVFLRLESGTPGGSAVAFVLSTAATVFLREYAGN